MTPSSNSKRLSDLAHGRDNNFNLIRIISAYAVLVTHSFALATGSPEAEPLSDSLGLTMGTIAVHVFFLTSGFLVTASLLRRQSTIEFLWARVLRIFPALLVMLALTTFGLGLLFTTESWLSYLADEQTRTYFVKCLVLVRGVTYELPGVFESNPYPGAMNGSLWTMPHEVRLYLALVAIWFLLRIVGRWRLRLFPIVVVTGAILAAICVGVRYPYWDEQGTALVLAFMFFTGSSLYVLRERVLLSTRAFCVVGTCLLATAASKQLFFWTYMACFPYLLFYAAYVPGGRVRRYNELGDYSYGLYIYAFPIQQAIAALLPGVSVVSMIALASIVTMLPAALSWHLLERHALALKASAVSQTRRVLASMPFSADKASRTDGP